MLVVLPSCCVAVITLQEPFCWDLILDICLDIKEDVCFLTIFKSNGVIWTDLLILNPYGCVIYSRLYRAEIRIVHLLECSRVNAAVILEPSHSLGSTGGCSVGVTTLQETLCCALIVDFASFKGTWLGFVTEDVWTGCGVSYILMHLAVNLEQGKEAFTLLQDYKPWNFTKFVAGYLALTFIGHIGVANSSF